MLARRAQQGLPTPSWDARPTLFEDLEPVWRAFWDLSACRSGGVNGANPLSPSDIKAHFEMMDVPEDVAKDWYPLIRFLDLTLLSHDARVRAEEKAKMEASRKKGRVPRHGNV